MLVDTGRPKNSASFFGCNGNKISLATLNSKYIMVSNDQANVNAKGITSRMVNTQFEVVDLGHGRFALKSIYGTYLAASSPKRVPYSPYVVYGVRLTSHYRDTGAFFRVNKGMVRGHYVFETQWAKYLKANADNSLTADGTKYDLLANFKPECIKGM